MTITTSYLQTAIEDAMEGGPALAASLGLGDATKGLTTALDDSWKRLTTFSAKPGAAKAPSKISADRIKSETAMKAEANPYSGITKDELDAVIRAGRSAHQPPEVLLALWAKEGSTKSVTAATPVAQATSEANAIALFRSTVYFVDMGIDHFIVVTTKKGADNKFDSSDSAAPGHEKRFKAQVAALVKEKLLSADLSAAINAELKVTTDKSGTFSVKPTTKFYALTLLLVDALFTKHLNAARADVPGASAALSYLHWNMRLSSWNDFVKSADKHRKEPEFEVGGKPISSEQWALHTKPKEKEFGQSRRNAIRFMHYIDSYAPIFSPSMKTITGTLAADALGAPIDPYAYNGTGTACATGPQAGAKALIVELKKHFGGRGEIFNCRPVRGGSRLSLHGEGRAVDWYRNANDPTQAAEAQKILDWLLGADADGNQHALARRMGVQECIWNHRIWTARRHAEGWRPYSGVSPHTDHIHIGMNWAGARMQTSFWKGVAPAAPSPVPAAPAPLPAGTVTFGSAADIDAYFTSKTGKHFLDWFKATHGQKGEWARRTTETNADTKARFAQVWNRIPEMFDSARITLEQFVALQSIFINELGGGMVPITEKMNPPTAKAHPGMAYLFDSFKLKSGHTKASYNSAKNGKTAFQCFNDPAFIAAHGHLAPGSHLAHTTDQRWAGHTWPEGEETDPAKAPFTAQADFCKFRGRGMVQTTWREGYARIVPWVQGYGGTSAKVLDYKKRWAGMGVQDVLTRSTNAHWDDLFLGSDYVVPCAAVKLHAHLAKRYLEISADPAIRLGTDRGSFAYMGYRISGSKDYGQLFKRRCLQILTSLGAAGTSAPAPSTAPAPVPTAPPATAPAPAPKAPAPAGAPAAGPPPSSALTWAGATPEQLAFMRATYDIHVGNSSKRRSFVANVPDAELGPVASGRMRKAAAPQLTAMLAAASKALAAKQSEGDAQAKSVEFIRPGSAYRSVSEQFGLWQKYFPGYYRDTQGTRGDKAKYPDGEHGRKAAEYMAGYVGRWIGAPGYSLHNDGRAIDLVTREGGTTLSASGKQSAQWRKSWLFNWLSANAAGFGFHQNTTINEPWHWEYRAPAGAQGPAAAPPVTIPAGEADVAVVPMLADHHDVGPDMILRWNALTDLSHGVDVVVHLHGYDPDRHLNLRDKLAFSGLDFVPPTLPPKEHAPVHPGWTGRVRPTLLVLPRGRARPDHWAAYDFPALVKPGAFGHLIDVALAELGARIGASAPIAARRIVLTAHSGGGSPLGRILAYTGETPSDPHEVHVFDALYGDPSALRGWVQRRLKRDVDALRTAPDPEAYMAADGGALRILWLHYNDKSTTRDNSLGVKRYVAKRIPATASSTDVLNRHYRVDQAAVGHMKVPYWYGGRLLADVTAKVAGPKKK